MNPELPSIGRPGVVVGGRFVLEALIGRGAVGEVWRANHTALGIPIALKLVSGAGADPEIVSRVVVEARSAAVIDSAHVVRILDQGEEGGVAWIAMELLEGESLADRLARQGRLSPIEVVRILAEVARGVSRAHEKGIVHRDLKPANIFLARVDGGEIAKVLDFGIAKVRGLEAVQTRQGIVVGTPAYMSREQVLGGRAVDHHADLWAIAVIAYECLEGELPYLATSMAEVFVQIAAPSGLLRRPLASASFAAWFERATLPVPEQRFATAPELVAALASALGVPAPSSMAGQAPPLDGRAVGSATSRVLVVAVFALGTLALILLVALVVELRGRSAPPTELARGASSESVPPAAGPSPGGAQGDATAPSAAASSAAAPLAPPEAPQSAAPSASAAGSSSARPAPRPMSDRWGI